MASGFPRYYQSPVDTGTLREKVATCKKDIREYFRVYHKALTETENVLITDLDEILARREKYKSDIDRQIKEVESAKEFMENQLKTCVNQVLTDNVVGLGQKITNLKSYQSVTPLRLNWKFNHVLRNIHELCTIEEGPSLYAGILNKPSMIPNSTLRDCWNFCFDNWGKTYYFIDTFSSSGDGKILVFDSLFNNLSSHMVKGSYPKTYIKTSKEFVFLANQYSPSRISKYTKMNINQGNLATIDLEGVPSKMDIFDGYLYTSSANNVIVRLEISKFKIAAKIEISRRRKDTILEGGTCIIDIKVSLNEILLLFNSSTERAIHSFDHSGIFLREVIGNHRGLHNPLNFCVNSNGIVFIADGKIKVFNTFGRQIDSFGEEHEDWAKCVVLDATTSRILVLAHLNGKCLHAYSAS